MPNAEGLARPPIDAEELAAFIDGRLEGERRQRVIQTLAEDEETYELYASVIEVCEALAAEPGGGTMPRVPPASEGGVAVPFGPTASVAAEPRRRRSWRRLFDGWRSERSGTRWLPVAAGLAAAALVAVVAAWWLLRPTGSRQLLAAFDAGTVTPAVASAAPDSLEPIMRSGDRKEKAAQFKLGARAFDLALAVEAGDRGSTARWLAEMSKLLEEAPWSFGLNQIYDDLLARLEAGESLRSLRGDIAEAEREVEPALDLAEQPLFAFGRWLAAVRTAALHGDRRFLASEAAREPLPIFRAAAPSEPVAGRLERIAAALGPAAETADLDAVAGAAVEIIRHCAGGGICLRGAPPPPDL